MDDQFRTIERACVAKSSSIARSLNRPMAVDVLLLTALWAIAILVVNPIGDFPLADDWSYGLTVKHLLETGEYRPQGWALAPLITNVLWGWIFCFPFGFGFTTLRLSTLLASLLALIGTYILIRELPQSRKIALIGAATLALNPLYLGLSFTFDTEILFTTLIVWSAVFFARHLRTGANIELITGTLLALAATLSRQFGLCVPIAYGYALVARSGYRAPLFARATMPTLLCLTGYIGLRFWLAASGRTPHVVDWNSDQLLETLTDTRLLVQIPAGNLYIFLIYLGLSVLPLLLVRPLADFARRPRLTASLTAISLGLLAICAGAQLARQDHIVRHHYEPFLFHYPPLLMPLVQDQLNPWGFGWLPWVPGFDWPRTYVLLGTWTVITLTGALAAALLIAKMGALGLQSLTIRSRGNPPADSPKTLLFVSAIVFFMPLLLVQLPFDRYIVPVIPFFLALIAYTQPSDSVKPVHIDRALSLVGLSLLIISGVLAVLMAHDNLAWNRIRWRALSDLIQRHHIDPHDIDGGFEFNGFYAYDPHRTRPFNRWRGDEEMSLPQGQSIVGNPSSLYKAAVGSVPGYFVCREYTYSHWLLSRTQHVLVLAKADSANANQAATGIAWAAAEAGHSKAGVKPVTSISNPCVSQPVP